MTNQQHVAAIETLLRTTIRQSPIDTIDRCSFIRVPYRDNDNKIDISIIFHRSWAEKEVIVQAPTGMVLIIPNFWLSVAPDVAIPYLIEDIKDFYTEMVPSWSADSELNLNCLR